MVSAGADRPYSVAPHWLQNRAVSSLSAWQPRQRSFTWGRGGRLGRRRGRRTLYTGRHVAERVARPGGGRLLVPRERVMHDPAAHAAPRLEVLARLLGGEHQAGGGEPARADGHQNEPDDHECHATERTQGHGSATRVEVREVAEVQRE